MRTPNPVPRTFTCTALWSMILAPEMELGPISQTETSTDNSQMSQAADVTDAQWDSVVLKSDVPVLVDFWADWCAPCKAMGPYVDRLAAEYEGRLKVLKLNTQDNPDVPANYGIMSIPTFLIVQNGEVVKQIIGSQPYDQLKAAVDPYL